MDFLVFLIVSQIFKTLLYRPLIGHGLVNIILLFKHIENNNDLWNTIMKEVSETIDSQNQSGQNVIISYKTSINLCISNYYLKKYFKQKFEFFLTFYVLIILLFFHIRN